MPSPFPGMDPYLEHPVLWPGVHQDLIGYSKAALNSILPPNYVANSGERIYVVQPDRYILPDTAVFEIPLAGSRAPDDSGTGAAVASDPPWVLVVEPVEVREVFIEILSLADEGERLVTAIEVLSYTNNPPGSEGRRLYLSKQRELLSSPVHLIEIDLSRNTDHIIAPPREELLLKGPWDYLVSLHRGGTANRYEVWAVTLRQRLPRIRVPLAGDDPDVILDLQEIFTRSYDAGRCGQRLNYRKEPHTPLSKEDAAWADRLLVEKGLR